MTRLFSYVMWISIIGDMFKYQAEIRYSQLLNIPLQISQKFIRFCSIGKDKNILVGI